MNTHGSTYNVIVLGKLRLTSVSIFLIAFLTNIPNLVFSQACCSGGVPLAGNLVMGVADGKTMQIQLAYDYNAMNDLVSVSDLLEDQTRSRSTRSSLLEINYGLNRKFSIAGVVPYLIQTRTIRGFNNNKDVTIVRGLGDIVLIAKYRITDPLKHQQVEWVVGVGPKFPAGRTNFANNQGFILSADMQPGSGSLDWIAWSYFAKNRIYNTNIGVISSTMYLFTGENSSYNASQTYQFGNEFQFNLGLNYNVFILRPVDFFALVNYRRQTEDLIDDNAFPSSGGQWINASAGLNYQFSPYGSFKLAGDIPVYRELDGTQLTTSYRIKAALSFTIPFKKNDIVLY